MNLFRPAQNVVRRCCIFPWMAITSVGIDWEVAATPTWLDTASAPHRWHSCAYRTYFSSWRLCHGCYCYKVMCLKTAEDGNKAISGPCYWCLTTPQCIHTVNILCLIGFIIPFRKSVVMSDFVYVMYYYYYFWNFRGSMLSHCRMISVACNYTEGEHMVCVLDFKRETGLWHAILSSVLNGMHVIFIPYALMKISPASWMHMITKYRWRIYFLHILISDWNYHIVSFFGLILIN